MRGWGECEESDKCIKLNGQYYDICIIINNITELVLI